MNLSASWIPGWRASVRRRREPMFKIARLVASVAADLDAIQSAAPTLSVADPEPPARVWTALRAQLIEEGLIRENVPVAAVEDKSWFARLFPSVPRPALAGGYLALLVALAFGLSSPFALHTSAPPSFPLSAAIGQCGADNRFVFCKL